jgi:hypothetical protein
VPTTGQRTTSAALGLCSHYGTRHWKTEVVAISVEMLSGRRKRDYEADSLAAQAEPGGAAGDDTGISPHEAAEVGVVSVPDTADDESPEDSAADDEQVLVLA